ncbi:MAG: TetR/AcrR family transcriptional regulator [Anaerolineales bacterium]|nr:TetR/AcrR family transcriptional regulator [Anaerolineales bacterium]
MDHVVPRGEQTRQTILLAAHDLFVEQGYHGTSMRQISRKAGIALGSLYNHFASKEAAFEAVFLTYHPYHEVIPHIMAAQGVSIEELIRDAATRMVAAVEDRPDFMNLMFIELVEFKSSHAQKLAHTLFPLGLQIVQKLLRSDPDRLRPIPPPILVRSFLGLFFSYFMTELIFAQSLPEEFRKDAMQDFVEIYLHGILKQ